MISIHKTLVGLREGEEIIIRKNEGTQTVNIQLRIGDRYLHRALSSFELMLANYSVLAAELNAALAQLRKAGS